MRSSSVLPLAMFAATGLFLGASAVRGQDTPSEGVARITDSPAPVADPISGGTASGQNVSNQSSDAVCNDDGYFGQGREYESPDHGWCRPIKYPIRRMPVQYYSYWPARWYGEPGSGIAPNAPRFPVIYTPTDTTQLGVYYQRVPQWLPNPAMIPPPPWPTEWHRRYCPGGGPAGTTVGSTAAKPKEQKESESQPKATPAPVPPPPIESDALASPAPANG